MACQSEPAPSSPPVRLACSEQRSGQFMAYAELADNKVKLAELPVCDTLPPAKYKDLGVPAGATSVIGGSDARGTAYLCAVPGAAGQVVFYLGTGEATELPAFTKIAVFEDGRFQILRPLGAGDLAGFYALSTPDSAFVLFLGLQGSQLTGRLFGKEGSLPPASQISRELRNFSTSSPMNFTCAVDQLTFSSPLGNGRVHWQPDTAALLFDTFRGQAGPVTFGKID